MPSPNSAQPRPAQASPSLSVGLAKALPKAFAYWIQMWRFRPPGGIGFGPFLARLRPPCRCVWLFWRAQPSPPQPSPAQPSPPHPPQPSPAQPTRPTLAHPNATQPSPARPTQPSPAQPAHSSPSAQCSPSHRSLGPSLGVGLYWIQMWRFRLTGGIGFGPFLACWGRRAAAFRCLEA